MLITLLETLNIFYSFALHTENFAGLRAGRNFHFDLAFECRHVNLSTQGRLDEADRYIANDVEIFPDKDRVRLHMNDDVEITGHAARRAGFAFAAQLQARSSVDSRRNPNTECMHVTYAPRTAARGTGVLNDRTLTLTLPASSGNAEKPLLETDLTTASACG